MSRRICVPCENVRRKQAETRTLCRSHRYIIIHFAAHTFSPCGSTHCTSTPNLSHSFGSMGHLLPYCHPGYIFITFTHLVPTRLLHIYCTRSSKKISSRPAQYNCFLIQLPLLFFQGFLVLHKRRIRNRKKRLELS